MLTFLKKFFKPKHPPENSTAPYKIEAPVVASPVKVAAVAPVAETTVNTEVNQIAVVAAGEASATPAPAKEKTPAKPRAPRKPKAST
jgi:hypothetical protein